jgi:hypothetical protein
MKKSPVKDEIVLGTDNWCFMGDTYTELYKGDLLFSRSQQDSILEIWKLRTSYFDSLNIPVHWVIGPMKNQIYSDKMPFNIVKGTGKTRFDEVKERIITEFPSLMIDPTDTFKNAKKTQKLYYKSDNHWNLTSGRLVSEMVLDAIRKDRPSWIIPQLPKYEWKDSTITWGNLKASIGIEDLVDRDIFPVLTSTKAKQVTSIGYPVTPGFGYDYLYEQRYKNTTDTSAPRILIIRDSYAFQMAPFLNECFSETLYIFDAWQYKQNKSIVESYKPDVVLFVSVEANLHLLLKFGASELH